MKQRKNKKVGAHYLVHNILRVGGHVGAPRWGYKELTSKNSR